MAILGSNIPAYLAQPVRTLKAYSRENLGADLLAGLSIAVVLLPQAIAYSLLAELPPQTGLYTAVIAGIVGALWGSSAHLHTGPTNAASLLVLATLLPVFSAGTPEYVAAASVLAIIVGLIRLVMGLLRLGILVNFVSDSVIIGFTAGAGVLISVNQLRGLLGLAVPSSPSLIETSRALLASLAEVHTPSLLLGLGTIVLILLVKRFRPKWPAAFLTMALAAVVVALPHLERDGIQVLGELPRTLPPLTDFSLVRLAQLPQLLSGAAAIAAIGLVEAMSISRSIAAQSGQYISSNQEFVGQGMASILSGTFSGYTSSGSFVRSAVNYETGGRTQLAGISSGIFVFVAALLFAPFTAYLPRAALAGVLIVTAVRMIHVQEIRRIWYGTRGDTLIMIATFLATLVLPLQFAVLSGVLVSILRYLVTSSTPTVATEIPGRTYQHFIPQRDEELCPQLAIISIKGSLFFGAAHHVEKIIRMELEKHPDQTYLMLRMNQVDLIDVSGIHMLESLVRLYRKKGGAVFLTGVQDPVRARMESMGFTDFIGENQFLVREEAIEYIFHHVLSPEVCIYECPVRVFAECQALPKYDLASKLPALECFDEKVVPSLLPSELETRLVEEDLLLVDVREEGEFRHGHIPGAVLVPMRTVIESAFAIPKSRTLILVCRTGRRSTMAAHIFQDLGYHNLFNLEGGMLAWRAAGLPVAIE